MRAPAACFLFALLAAPAAEAASLCDSLFVPDDYTLVCETRIEAGKRSERVVVRPAAGAGAVLAELTLRPLDRSEAPLAWSDPDQWLANQLAVDVSGISTSLQGWSAAGPLAHPIAKATVDGLITMLAGWSRLPLEGCTPNDKPPRHELDCRWGVAPLALAMDLRLVPVGDQRFAISYWAADERRMQHLEAIANSFKPG